MRVFEFITVIVVVSLIYSALMTMFKSRRDRAQQADVEADQLADRERIENLEARVNVLEKIVTDRKSSLHRQFSDLE